MGVRSPCNAVMMLVMCEYVIGPVDHETFMVVHRDRQAEVFTPKGFDAQQVPGWGDFRLRLGPTDVAFSGQDLGLHVIFEGEVPTDRSDAFVAAVARQIQQELGVETYWLRIG